jgi:hypothetical protein
VRMMIGGVMVGFVWHRLLKCLPSGTWLAITIPQPEI